MSKKKTRAKPRHDLSGFSVVEASEVFGMTPQTVGRFDCPKDPDGTWNIGALLRWYIGKQKEKPRAKLDLESEKLRLQCEKLQIDIEKMKAESIPLETHKQIFASRALSLKNYFMEFFTKNIHLYAHKSIEQLRPMVQEHVAAMMNNYSSNHR
jgi:hypothetical protein